VKKAVDIPNLLGSIAADHQQRLGFDAKVFLRHTLQTIAEAQFPFEPNDFRVGGSDRLLLPKNPGHE